MSATPVSTCPIRIVALPREIHREVHARGGELPLEGTPQGRIDLPEQRVVAHVEQLPPLAERRDVADSRVVRRRREEPVQVRGIETNPRCVEQRDRRHPVEAVVVAERLKIAIGLEPDHCGEAERARVGELACAPLQCPRRRMPPEPVELPLQGGRRERRSPGWYESLRCGVCERRRQEQRAESCRNCSRKSVGRAGHEPSSRSATAGWGRLLEARPVRYKDSCSALDARLQEGLGDRVPGPRTP
jgi:hypothetical protein